MIKYIFVKIFKIAIHANVSASDTYVWPRELIKICRFYEWCIWQYFLFWLSLKLIRVCHWKRFFKIGRITREHLNYVGSWGICMCLIKDDFKGSVNSVSCSCNGGKSVATTTADSAVYSLNKRQTHVFSDNSFVQMIPFVGSLTERVKDNTGRRER